MSAVPESLKPYSRGPPPSVPHWSTKVGQVLALRSLHSPPSSEAVVLTSGPEAARSEIRGLGPSLHPSHCHLSQGQWHTRPSPGLAQM